jgi:hypothetical protein
MPIKLYFSLEITHPDSSCYENMLVISHISLLVFAANLLLLSENTFLLFFYLSRFYSSNSALFTDLPLMILVHLDHVFP